MFHLIVRVLLLFILTNGFDFLSTWILSNQRIYSLHNFIICLHSLINIQYFSFCVCSDYSFLFNYRFQLIIFMRFFYLNFFFSHSKYFNALFLQITSMDWFTWILFFFFIVFIDSSKHLLNERKYYFASLFLRFLFWIGQKNSIYCCLIHLHKILQPQKSNHFR